MELSIRGRCLPILVCAFSVLLSGCDDDDSVEVIEIETPVIVTNTQVQVVEVPVLVPVTEGNAKQVQLGSRPYFLIDELADGELKTALAECKDGPFYKTDFSISHRGAPMQFPEHTKEGYEAAARMGAGVVECDVTFTQDKELVCRHSQCDLHTTTDILAIPNLAEKCSTPFVAADAENGIAAQAKCCTSDITLAEFKQLKGKMDAANPAATTVAEYMDGTANWRTDLYSSRGTLMTHAESIELFKSLDVKMTPELKSASVAMPFEGMTQQDYAQKLIAEYEAADVDPSDVYPQSFNLDDVKSWLANKPAFGAQAVYLDGRYDDPNFNPNQSSTWAPSMVELAEEGVKIIAPPLWILVTLDENNNIVPSEYAKSAKASGLKIITWTLERSGPLSSGGGWYYQSIANAIDKDSDQYRLLHVLAKEVGVIGVFSDWPATTSYYASCMNMPVSL